MLIIHKHHPERSIDWNHAIDVPLPVLNTSTLRAGHIAFPVAWAQVVSACWKPKRVPWPFLIDEILEARL